LDRQKLCELNEMIANAAKLAKEILDRFSTMNVDPEAQYRDVRLDDLLREVVGMIEFTAQAKQVDVQCDLQEVRASVDHVEMQQVVINLLKNAIDAAAENEVGNGQVTVELRSTACSAEIIVSDNGPGLGEMPPDKMFDALVSSKDQGRGFGLSISKRIVDSHSGRLWFQPNRPRGASFHVSLPRSK
jgi:signal transduction histidine kinase